MSAAMSAGATVDGMTFTIANAVATSSWNVGDQFSFSATAAKATLQLKDSGGTNIGVAQTVHYGDAVATIGDAKIGKTVDAGFKFSNLVAGTAQFTVADTASTAAQVSAGTVNAAAVTAAGINVSDQGNANKAITAIDNAIKTVSVERSKLGAYQNRLEHTITNLGTSSENMTAAESRIRDVDMAKEMMSFQKNQILSQAATSMLAQANQQPQNVLKLLG